MSRNRQSKNQEQEHSKSFGFTIKDVFNIKPHIEISGNTSATIDGCRGVLEYSETQIRVSLGQVSMQMKGRGLTLKCISPTSLIINGFITSVEYIM